MATRDDHNVYQAQVITPEADGFLEPIPPDIEARTARIVDSIPLGPKDTVLDVGCGTGVLIPHLQQRGVTDIVGCDLTEGMIARARTRHPDLRFEICDVVDLPDELGPFSAAFFNAMFGNVFDQRQVLSSVAPRMQPGGHLVISHPMGRGFVADLHEADIARTPHPLPDEHRLATLAEDLPLVPALFVDEPDLYIAVLQRTR